MYRYIIRRLLMLPILLFGVSILIFGMLQFLTPYERAALYVSDIPKREGAIDDIVEKYGLNDPFYEQYGRWIGNVLKGDLGFSKTGKQPVAELIKTYFPATAELALWAAFPLIYIGIQLGILSATHQNSLLDWFVRTFAVIGWSFPTFVFGLLMLMIFYAKLDWFPAGRLSDWAAQAIASEGFRQITRMHSFDALLNGRLDIFWDALRHIILPVITLSYLSWALLMRVTRSSMLEVMRQEYVNTARAKGLANRDVVNRHARPNAMIPVVTIGGLTLVGLLSGLVITETIFNYRGMGYFFAQAASQLDVITVLGFAMFNGAILVLGNLVVDILYGFIDPRVRLS
ncbi:MAG: ABC transporter permease [Chloroflexi bacterium]|nr:ABC transporter permease [Chloroflexota bacterium]